MIKIGSRGAIALGAWVLAGVSLGPSAVADPAAPAPSAPPSAEEIYGQLPEAQSARLSPDGNLLALVAAHGQRVAFAISSLDDDRSPKVIGTGDMEPDWFVWKNDSRLLASIRSVSFRMVNRPTVDTRLVAVDADGSHMTELKFKHDSDEPGAIGSFHWGGWKNARPQFQDRIVSLLPGDPSHILMEVTPAED